MFYCFPGPLFRKKMSLEHPTARWSSVTSILHTFWLKNITFAQWFRLFSNVVSASSRCFFLKKQVRRNEKKPRSVELPRSRLLPFSRPMTCQNVSQVAGAEAPVLTKKFLVGQKNVESQGGKLSMILNVWVFLTYIWVFPKIGGTAKLSSLIGFSIVNHRFWGTPIFGNTHLGSFG